MSESKEVCPECQRDIPERCVVCRQFVYELPDPEDTCRVCGQEDTDEEDEDDNTDYKGYSFRKRRDHSQQAICDWCERPVATCPKCQRDFISDDEDEEYDDEEDSDEEEDHDKKKSRK